MMTPTPRCSERKTKFIIWMILLLFPLVGMSIDLIAPSLPAIAKDLHTSTSAAKNLISIYLISYAIGNLFIGFLSDVWGRQKFILGGLLIFAITSLLPVLYGDITVLYITRLFQGITLAAISVLGRAVFADILPTEKLTHYAPLMAMMWGIGPIIGPVIGGYLQFYFGWQACFIFYSAFGFLGFIALAVLLPETIPSKQTFDLFKIKDNFITLITHKIFLGLIIIMGAAYSLMIVFNTLAPFYIQTILGKSSIYFGHVALFMGLAYLIGTIICRRLLKSFAAESILISATIFVATITIIELVLSYIAHEEIYALIIPSFLIFIGSGILYPVGMGKNLGLFRHMAGSASSVMSFVNFFFTSLVAMIIGFINIESAIPIAWMYLVLLLICFICYFALIQKAQ